MFRRPPYDETDPAAWLVYADWLQDSGCQGWQYCEALRFAAGLERAADRRLALLAYRVRNGFATGPRMVFSRSGTHRFYRWSPEGQVGFDNLIVGVDQLNELTHLCWVTLAGAKRCCSASVSPIDDSERDREDILVTPADFPELISDEPGADNLLARDFFAKLSRGLRVVLKKEEPYLQVRRDGVLIDYVPFTRRNRT